MNGEFIERNAGVGSNYFSLNARVSRSFQLTGRLELEGILEGFNLTNHRNVVTRNTNFGPGAYPSNPLPSFGQVTAVGGAAHAAARAACDVLMLFVDGLCPDGNFFWCHRAKRNFPRVDVVPVFDIDSVLRA